MPTAIITGSGGLVGSESVRHFVEAGYDVVGLDNDMRAQLLRSRGLDATGHRRAARALPEFHAVDVDIRDAEQIDAIFARHARQLAIVVHTAAQPSHDWAASDPTADFTVNANGTLNVLEATRRHVPDATFVNMSTNKVYGDLPNQLPLVELDSRLELPDVSPVEPRDRHVDVDRRNPPTLCSVSRRPPVICWYRSTAATSTCRPCAFAAAA